MADIMRSRSSLPNMADLFDRFFFGWPTYSGEGGTWAPRVDVHETDKEIHLYVEVPGVNKDDIKVEVKNNVLTISGERKQQPKGEKAEYSRVERNYGKFERSFGLPDTVKADSIGANYKDGVLTITLQKTEKAMPKEIAVEVK